MLKFIKKKYSKIFLTKQIHIINKSGLFNEEFYFSLYPDVRGFSGGGIAHYIIYGENEGRKPNLFFDPIWYINNYPINGKSPLLHYISTGELKGHKPSPSFDPTWYSKKYDINNKISPLKHFLKRGFSNKNLPNKYFLSPCHKESEKSNKASLKSAVVIHAYYLEMIPSIMSRISKSSLNFDLFFTVSLEQETELIKVLNKLGVINYEVIVCSTGGYDIAPFLEVLPHLQANNYELVCKLHTKKGSGEQGEIWFNTLTDSIIGSEYTVKQIISKFEADQHLGLVGGSVVYKSAKRLMYGNLPFIESFLTKKETSNQLKNDWGFFAGTMFWARLDIFNPLINNQELNNLIISEKHNEETGSSASIFHAIERVFGLLPSLTNKNTAISYPTDISQTRHAIKTIPIDGNIESPMAISMSLKSELSVKKIIDSNYRC